MQPQPVAPLDELLGVLDQVRNARKGLTSDDARRSLPELVSMLEAAAAQMQAAHSAIQSGGSTTAELRAVVGALKSELAALRMVAHETLNLVASWLRHADIGVTYGAHGELSAGTPSRVSVEV